MCVELLLWFMLLLACGCAGDPIPVNKLEEEDALEVGGMVVWDDAAADDVGGCGSERVPGCSIKWLCGESGIFGWPLTGSGRFRCWSCGR